MPMQLACKCGDDRPYTRSFVRQVSRPVLKISWHCHEFSTETFLRLS